MNRASRYNKIVVGLALANELHLRKASHDLVDVYRTPNKRRIKILHDRLSTSTDDVDQETALFLGLALNGDPREVDLHQLLVTLKEIEVLLFEFMRQASGSTQRNLNDWYNYLVNASQSLHDGDFFDAKILMNRAYQSAKRTTVDNSPSKYALRSKIAILRTGTLDASQKIQEIPIRLRVPEARHELIVEELDVLIESLTLLRECGEATISSAIGLVIQKVNAALRITMRSVDVKDAVREIDAAIKILDEWQNKPSSGELTHWTERTHLKLSKVRDHTLKHLAGQRGTIR